MRVFEQLGNNRVIPVIVVEDADHAVPMAEALVEGGVTALEVTLRTPVGLEVIERIARAVPEAIVGAGTVTDASQFQQVIDAGGRFAVSPGITDSLAITANASGLPWLPGTVTASEILLAIQLGFEDLKFFPASVSGGPPAIKAFTSVFSNIRFCPTGGVKPENMADYLGIENVMAVGGSWLVTNELLEKQDWAHMTRRAQEAVARARDILGEG